MKACFDIQRIKLGFCSEGSPGELLPPGQPDAGERLSWCSLTKNIVSLRPWSPIYLVV